MEDSVDMTITISSFYRSSTFNFSGVSDLTVTHDKDSGYRFTFKSKGATASGRVMDELVAQAQEKSDVRIVTVYLKGDYARPGQHSGHDWDRGIVNLQTATQITLQDNEYGLNKRTYQMIDTARIEETGHW